MVGTRGALSCPDPCGPHPHLSLYQEILDALKEGDGSNIRDEAVVGMRRVQPGQTLGAAGSAGPRGRRAPGVKGGPQGRCAATRSPLDFGRAASQTLRPIPPRPAVTRPAARPVRRLPRPGRLPVTNPHQWPVILRRPAELPALRVSRQCQRPARPGGGACGPLQAVLKRY